MCDKSTMVVTLQNHSGIHNSTSCLNAAGACARAGGGGDAVEWKGPQRQPQKRLGRRLEEVAKSVERGYCRLENPIEAGTCRQGEVAGHRLGALEGGGWGFREKRMLEGGGLGGGVGECPKGGG